MRVNISLRADEGDYEDRDYTTFGYDWTGFIEDPSAMLDGLRSLIFDYANPHLSEIGDWLDSLHVELEDYATEKEAASAPRE